nr:hypothetical protein [Tanacetum cinerariifolium]
IVRDVTLEGVSLSIPGNEKRYETDEVLYAFLDFDAKGAKRSGFRVKLNRIQNAIFVNGYIQPTLDASFVRFYSSRINLGNEIFYKTIRTEQKDGGLMLILHKNPDNAPCVKMN